MATGGQWSFAGETNPCYIQLLKLSMQAIASASAGTMNQTTRPSLWRSLQHFFGRRIFPGFRVGEMLLWMIFFISWPLMLVIIYNITGRFNDPGFMPFSQFASIQAFVLTGKAVFILPFWWLYFVKLKNLSLSKKIALHFLTSPVYIGLCIASLYVALVHILHLPYPRNSRLADVYNLMINYVSHFTLFHAYNFWLHTREQMKKEQAIKELAYQTEIKALKSQIEPHFLFNTLNSISASVPPSLEKTRVLIAQLADTFRYALQVSETQWITLKEEVDFLKTWLALEQHRFGKRLQVVYKIDDECLSYKIPPMLLQPVIENSLKHGLSEKLEGGKVTIECWLDDKAVVIAISDTGTGYCGELENMLNKGIGLSNISRRLQLLFNETIQVERGEQGLRFSFRVPAVVHVAAQKPAMAGHA
jgi:two-component system, LytTR family, sensor kinase